MQRQHAVLKVIIFFVYDFRFLINLTSWFLSVSNDVPSLPVEGKKVVDNTKAVPLVTVLDNWNPPLATAKTLKRKLDFLGLYITFKKL